jgi:hypothetical protein
LIVNVDESNWHLVMAAEETVAERGAESVHQYVDGGPKVNFSFFAAITAEGQRLPLILIAKGRTCRCHKQVGHHRQHQFDIWHSPAGWSTEPLMLDYLDWFRFQMPPEPLCLLLDQFETHPTELVTTKAEALGIEMIWIPKGATGRYQPFDRRTFGAQTATGRVKWRYQFAEHDGMGCTPEIAAELLVQSWDEFSDSNVAAGWDYGEEFDDDEETDDSDDEFHLDMATDTDDEDVIALQNEIEQNDEADMGQLENPE